MSYFIVAYLQPGDMEHLNGGMPVSPVPARSNDTGLSGSIPMFIQATSASKMGAIPVDDRSALGDTGLRDAGTA